MSNQINWIDFLLNTLKIGRTSQFIGHLGVTVRLNSINGSDETVHHELFQLNCGHPILMERSDEAMWICIMKHIRCASVGSQSDDRNAFLRVTSRPL